MTSNADFLAAPIAFIIAFFVSKFALLFSVTSGVKGVIIFSLLLFLLSLFFLRASQKTMYRRKEVLFVVISSTCLFMSTFGAVDVLGIVRLTPMVGLFVLLFFAYLFFERGEFLRIFITSSLTLLVALTLIVSLKLNDIISSSIIVLGGLFAILFHYLGTQASSFERASFMSLMFGWSILLSLDKAIFMLWGI